MYSDNKPKIVVLGSCSVDFTSYAPRLPKPGETLQGTKFTTSHGGKGANQCVAAAKLGGDTYMICKLGDDQWGKQYKEHLKSIGVNITHANILPKATTGSAQITVAENGENQIVVVAGANNHLGKTDVQRATDLIKYADVLIGQLETPLESALEAFKLNTTGLKLFNAAPAKPNIHEILPYCSILCVNESEASVLSNIEVDITRGFTSATEAIGRFLSAGCEMVIITLGENGAIYASKKERRPIHVMSEKVAPVDTTGAGDAFVGALATFLVTYKGYPIHQVIGAACEYATLSVTKEGTQTSYPTNFKPFSKEYKYVNL